MSDGHGQREGRRVATPGAPGPAGTGERRRVPPLTTASVLMADVFEVQPYTSHCHVIHDEGAHAVIGVSPGNSYSSARRLHDLAHWGLDHFDRVDFVCTDLYVAEMYEASGYPPDDARRKAVCCASTCPSPTRCPGSRRRTSGSAGP